MRRNDCDNVGERLSEYLDEALSGRDMQHVAAHLSICEDCRQEFDDLRVTKALLQREAVPPPALDF
jgi:predicted anti-sigma-YlaC factor YlaD